MVCWPGESLARIGLTGLRSVCMRSCTHQCLSFPGAGVQYGLNSGSFKKECNKVRKACHFEFTFRKII